ncbi:MAG: HAD-IIA family hydrolase [Armatimonadota bacterium]
MLFIFDLDGVVYRGDEPVPYSAEAVAYLRDQGHYVCFLTNNSACTRTYYSQKLARFGISAEPSDVMTSAYATALRLQEMGLSGARVMVVGEQGLRQELSLAGVRFVEACNGSRADVVVVGIDRTFTYQKLKAAQQAILQGAVFIATNRDATYPLEEGAVEPGGGAIVAAIEVASGRTPILIGKPSDYTVRKILEAHGAQPEDAVIVGDRLDTDIAVGNAVGLKTVLVLTGVSTVQQVSDADPSTTPDLVLPDLRGLSSAIERL